MSEMPGTEFEMKADLVLLAMGFTGPVHAGLVEQSRVARDPRSNVMANTEDYRTSVDKIFRRRRHAARPVARRMGDREGRQCARSVDLFLMGATELPR
jgi:glutamate synthase (NADPH/NADH) small chain